MNGTQFDNGWRLRHCAQIIIISACCWLWECTDSNGEKAGGDGDSEGIGGSGAVTLGNNDALPSEESRGDAGGGVGTTGEKDDSASSRDGGTAAASESGGGTSAAGNGGIESDSAAADATSISIYTLRVYTPQIGATVGGLVTVSGYAPGFENVEVWDATHQQPPLAQATPASDGSFSAVINSSSLEQGPTTWTVWAWDSPPGQSFSHNASFELQLTINQDPESQGSGGNSGSGGDDGRDFILGIFSSGSEITSYSAYLGYHPEFTINSSYQDEHHQQCGQAISGLNDINNYPVIVSVFTYNKDYAGTARGTHDSCYHTLFSGLASKAATIYGVRIDVEFWPHPPASEFKASFDQIVAIAKQYLPARIKYVFNPNWDAGLGGAEYVPESADIIGPDAYNNPQWCQDKSSEQCADDKFDPNRPGSIAFWTKVAQQLGKPMALPEFGDDYGDGVYIDRVADWAYDEVLVTPGVSNNVVFIAYWDSNLNEDAYLRNGAKDVFQQRFGNRPYAGGYWGALIPTTAFGAY
ncbi:MAG: hypothetical protein JXA30_08575 [Deltaproteobacteria bacterium]|nr:hypothetical protein [Deltaproteobacteria bacterium]